MIKVSDLKMPLDFTNEQLEEAAAKRLRLSRGALEFRTVLKKSVDARDKENVFFVVSAAFDAGVNEKKLVERAKDHRLSLYREAKYTLPDPSGVRKRPIVAGFGPAGMFAALILAQCGLKPLVLERGEPVEKREKTVRNFWLTRKLSENSNVQFGEGGAGTFSDGKLNTGTRDPRIKKVLGELVRFGAPDGILYDSKPHIGTDRLPGVVRALRSEITALGGEVRFETQLENISVQDGLLESVTLSSPSGKEKLPCKALILAPGHSARDTFEMLNEKGVCLEAKPFSVGARIEHPRELIDRAQYGNFADNNALGAADYKLAAHLKNGRGIYTFCMCPGGYVTGAASELGGVVTNGMSEYSRDAENSNSAVLVGVGEKDFGGTGPLAGVYFQRRIERMAFDAAGGDYSAPAQRLEDFLTGRKSSGFTGVKPTYLPGVFKADIAECLPDFISDSLRAGIGELAKKLRGFDFPDAVLTAPETRSSSPVRILRDSSTQSVSVKGLFPCGEGAGYAGGIVSAAVDGIRSAEAFIALEKNAPL